jgi:hypothetical protein
MFITAAIVFVSVARRAATVFQKLDVELLRGAVSRPRPGAHEE